MGSKEIEGTIRTRKTLAALDAYGLKLANRGHIWTPRERKAFERQVRYLKSQKKK